MKLEMAILAGAESKQWLASFTKQLDRLEVLAGRLGGHAAEGEQTSDTDVEADTAPKTRRGRPAKQAAPETFDGEDADAVEGIETDFEGSSETDDDEDFTEVKTTKKTAAAVKPPKYTLDDVNDACKAKARAAGGGKPGRDKVLSILKKNFNTLSVSELKPEQYGKAIGLLA